MADGSFSEVDVWSLARSGRDGSLALGMTRSEVKAAFGEATDIAQHIFKYDSVELHFVDEVLWMIHCEFGDAPLPPGVHSDALGVQPGGLQWPLRQDSLAQLVEDKGFDPHGLVSAVLS